MVALGHHELLTLNETARLLRLDPRTVRRHIRCGELPAVKVSGVWRLDVVHLNERLRPRQTNRGEALTVTTGTGSTTSIHVTYSLAG
jgi:excisionase family DNA binding protein